MLVVGWRDLETERRYGEAKRAEGVAWMEVSNMDSKWSLMLVMQSK